MTVLVSRYPAYSLFDRELCIQKFTWDSSGFPSFGHPIPSGVLQSLPSGEEGRTVFFDSFEDGNANGWTTDGDSWAVIKPVGHSYEYAMLSNGYNLSAAGGNWTDYLVQAAILLTSDTQGAGAGILGRVVDNNHFYQLEIYNYNGTKTWHLNKNDGGVWSELASGPFNYSTNYYYYLKMVLAGSSITAYILSDGGATYQYLGAASDSSFTSGKIGTRGTLQPYRIDNVQVQLKE